MNATVQTFQPIAARPAPVHRTGWLSTLQQRNLFSSIPNAVLSLLLLAVFAWLAVKGFSWGMANAVFAANADACQAARGIGACWGVVNEKARFILLGRYPQADRKSVV